MSDKIITLSQQLETLSDEKLQVLWNVFTDPEIRGCLCSQEAVIIAGLQLRVSMELTRREETQARERQESQEDE